VKHLRRDLAMLQRRLLELGNRVEQAIADAVDALIERDEVRARRVLVHEEAIDSLEVHVEEECLKILALHQPVASDLRFVITVLKVDNDLERMGDAATSMAARALQILKLPATDLPPQLPEMVRGARAMARKALDCLLRADVARAREVLDDDAAIDAAQRSLFELLQARMRARPDTVDASVLLLSVTRQVERIADLATNIAEDVIFLHEGEIVRHRQSQPRER
jgi:phosphate transport system protein